MPDERITPELEKFGEDVFSQLDFSPDFTNIVAGCLRRGRNGEGVEIVVNTARGSFSLSSEDQEQVKAGVESGTPQDVCMTIRNALSRELLIEEIF